MTKPMAKGQNLTSAPCAACGAEFNKKRDWHIFCSDTCRKDSWKTNKMNTRRIIQLEARLERIEHHLGIKERVYQDGKGPR